MLNQLVDMILVFYFYGIGCDHVGPGNSAFWVITIDILNKRSS